MTSEDGNEVIHIWHYRKAERLITSVAYGRRQQSGYRSCDKMIRVLTHSLRQGWKKGQLPATREEFAASVSGESVVFFVFQLQSDWSIARPWRRWPFVSSPMRPEAQCRGMTMAASRTKRRASSGTWGNWPGDRRKRPITACMPSISNVFSTLLRAQSGIVIAPRGSRAKKSRLAGCCQGTKKYSKRSQKKSPPTKPGRGAGAEALDEVAS